MTDPLRYEDAARWREDIKGWCCVRGHFRGLGADAEHRARYCCCTDMPCPQCGGRITNKSYTVCQACCEKHDRQRSEEKWAKLPRVEWDGETPLCQFDNDVFFFSVEDIENWLDSADQDDPPRRLEDLLVVLCEPADKPEFSLREFLKDILPFDDEADFADRHEFDLIDKQVNDFIAKLGVISWWASDKAVSTEELRKWVSEDQP